MQVFSDNGQKLDFTKPKALGHLFHSSPARARLMLLGNNDRFAGFPGDASTKSLSSPNQTLNVKGNGLPSEKFPASLESKHEVDNSSKNHESNNDDNRNNYHSNNNDEDISEKSKWSAVGFFKKTTPEKQKQAKNIRKSVLPQLCHELRERQKSENISDIWLSSSPTLPAFSSSVMYKKKFSDNPGRKLKEPKGFSPLRGFMVHTGRYQWSNQKWKSLSEEESNDNQFCSSLKNPLLRLRHKQITIPPIRSNTLHVVLGGKKIEMEERFNLMREIQRLKCVVLPDHARHLFHGKGFKLPMTHGSLKPRGISVPDYVKEDSEGNSRHLKCRQPTNILDQKERDQLNQLKKSSSFTGSHTAPSCSSSVLISKQKIAIKRLKTKLNLSSSTSQQPIPISTPLPPPPSPPPPSLQQQQQQQQPVQISKRPRPKNVTDETNLLESLNRKNVEEAAEFNNSDNFHQTKEEDESGFQSSAISESGDNKEQDIHPHKQPLNHLQVLATTSIDSVSSSEKDILKETFQKLDSDKDGHLLYNQLKSVLPAKFSINQEKFIKEVYNITSEKTFFGISEFWGMTQLTRSIEALSGPALEAYENLNFENLKDSILQYLTEFQLADPSSKGSIPLADLCVLLSKHTKQDFQNNQTSWNQVLTNIILTEPDNIRKTNFLAHIPYFLNL